jgi:hypothetical protein
MGPSGAHAFDIRAQREQGVSIQVKSLRRTANSPMLHIIGDTSRIQREESQTDTIDRQAPTASPPPPPAP